MQQSERDLFGIHTPRFNNDRIKQARELAGLTQEKLAEFERTGIEVEESDLLFTSPVTGRHYHASPIQQDYFRPAWCCLVECPTCGAGAGVWCLTDAPVPNGKRLPIHDERWEAAGKYGHIGWRTFGIPTVPGWIALQRRSVCNKS